MDISNISVNGDVGVIMEADNTTPCVLCKSPEVDDVNLGPIYTYEDVVCHYYCLLFSAALSQTGSDDQGILGFMPPEIWKEVRRASRLKCAICRKNGASIGCCKTNCHRAFHFPCGLKNGSNYQFIKDYQVFCKNHADIPEVSQEVKYMDSSCLICLSPVLKSDDPIMASCCKPSVYHKTCLRQMALNAGYFFKCPLCNAGQEFVEAMREQGVFVPEQDASWEREPNAFQELYEQYQRCDAKVCECSKGRGYAASKGGFLLARCRLCGAKGTHRQCGNLKTIAKWACEDCLVAEKNAEIKKMVQVKPKARKPCVKKQSVSTPKRVKVLSSQNSDDIVDMSKVSISSKCFAYFPYTEAQMKRFQRKRKQIIPDWRGLKVQCNLVNWIGNAFEKSRQAKDSQPLELKIQSAPLSKAKIQLKPQIPETLRKVVKSAKSSKPRRRFKLSKWQRGVVKPRKQQHFAKSTVPEEVASTPLIEEPIPSTSRQALEELMQANNSNEKVPSPPASGSFFKVPNPLKKPMIVKKPACNSVTTLLIQNVVEISSAGSDMCTPNIDYTALRPLQSYFEDEFMLVDYNLIQRFYSTMHEEEVVLTEIIVGEFGQNKAHDSFEKVASENYSTGYKKEEPKENHITVLQPGNSAEAICELIEGILAVDEGQTEMLEDDPEYDSDMDQECNNSNGVDAYSGYHEDHSYSMRLDQFPLVVNFNDQSDDSTGMSFIKTENTDCGVMLETKESVANESHISVKHRLDEYEDFPKTEV